MRNYLYTLLAVTAAVLVVSTGANAAGRNLLGGAVKAQTEDSNIVKVRSRGRGYSVLRRYGYYRINYLTRYYDYRDRPIYRYKACKHRRKYVVDVNWRGRIIRKRRSGRCYYKHYRHHRKRHYGHKYY